MPKFSKKVEELETHFEKWLFILKWLNNLQLRPQPLQNRVFRKIFKLAEIAKFNKMERTQYEESLKHYRDYQNTMDFAVKQAKEEMVLEIIKNGLDKNFSIQQLSDLTELTVEQINEIITDNGW